MALPVHSPVYDGQFVRLVDADTVLMRLDKDHGVEFTHPRGIRLLGVDADERYTETGKAATAFAAEWISAALRLPSTPTLGPSWPFVVVGSAEDKYGRPLGTVYRKTDGACLNTDLIDSGHATPMSLAAHFH